MTQIKLKALPLADLREAYRAYLLSTDLSKSTIQVSTSDAFYIWRKANASKFWEIVESPNFEDEAFSALRQLLPSQPDGSPSKNIQGYLAHLRRFRKFAFGNTSSFSSLPIAAPHRKYTRTVKVLLPRPC